MTQKSQRVLFSSWIPLKMCCSSLVVAVDKIDSSQPSFKLTDSFVWRQSVAHDAQRTSAAFDEYWADNVNNNHRFHAKSVKNVSLTESYSNVQRVVCGINFNSKKKKKLFPRFAHEPNLKTSDSDPMLAIEQHKRISSKIRQWFMVRIKVSYESRNTLNAK